MEPNLHDISDPPVSAAAPYSQRFASTRQTPARDPFSSGKYFLLILNATLTRLISTGTSTSGPITAANAAPWLIPKTPTATAIASSKLLLAAVNERGAE